MHYICKERAARCYRRFSCYCVKLHGNYTGFEHVRTNVHVRMCIRYLATVHAKCVASPLHMDDRIIKKNLDPLENPLHMCL